MDINSQLCEKIAKEALQFIMNSFYNEFESISEIMAHSYKTTDFLLFIFVCEAVKKEHLLQHVKNQQKHFLECIKEFLKKTSH